MEKITEDTIRRAGQGDECAFELIYKEYFGFVANVAYRIVSKQEEAEEICQEVFMIVYRKLKDFRGDSALKTWIYRITINHAVKYAKRMQRKNKGTLEFDERLLIVKNATDARDRIDARENENRITALLERLTPQQRACIVLRSFEGLSYQQIAETLKIPINTVRSRIKRARETLIALRNEVMAHEM